MSASTVQPGNGAVKGERGSFCARCGWVSLVPFARCVAKVPCIFIVCNLAWVLVLIFLGLVMGTITVEPNFDSFVKTDVNSSIKLDAFNSALEVRTASNRRLQNGSLPADKTDFSVEIYYELLGTHNMTGGILNQAALRPIAKLERELRAMEKWRELCSESYDGLTSLCDPGISYANYGLARQDTPVDTVVPSAIILDGSSWGPLPVSLAMSLAGRHQFAQILFPNGFDSTESPETLSTNLLRSVFRFRIGYGDAGDTAAERRQKKEKLVDRWADFVRDDVMPKLDKGFEVDERYEDNLADAPRLEVYYTGTEIKDQEVFAALKRDMLLAAASFAFVVVYMIFHTRSIFQSFLGLFAALLAVPLSFSVCALLGNSTVSFASFLAVFLTIGFGCDTVLIYTDYWRDSANQCEGLTEATENSPSWEERLAWTFWHGGVASLATTGTTALSFLANLASVIRALRQFGFFMGLCVMFAWLLITLIYVPFCVMDERCLRCCRLISRSTLRREKSISGRSIYFGKFGRHIHHWRCVYIALPVILLVVGVVWAMAAMDLSLVSPTLFPEDHNRVHVEKASDEFPELSIAFPYEIDTAPQREELCEAPGDYIFGSQSDCVGAVHWCDAQAYSPPTAGQCRCSHRDLPLCNSTKAVITTRVVGSSLHLGEIEREVLARTEATVAGSLGERFNDVDVQEKHQMLLQEWMSGEARLQKSVEVTQEYRRSFGQTCGYDEVCFCDALICKAPGSTTAGAWAISSTPLMLQARRLDTLHPVAEPRRLVLTQREAAKTRVVWGLKIDNDPAMLWEDKKEVWSFDPGFDIKDPWTQRNIYSFCTNPPPQLKVTQLWCWIAEFRTCTESLGGKFPQLPHRFMSYANQCDITSRYLWIRDGEVKATYSSFIMNVRKTYPSDKALLLMDQWDLAIDAMNAKAQADGAAWGSGAIHVSDLWVDAESKDAMIESLAITIIVLLVLAFAGMMIFTFSLALSLWVIMATIAVLCGLLFFIVVVMQWKIGMIEGISIIYFIGYALTYSLHVAHVYAGDISREPMPTKEDHVYDESGAIRYQRTNFTLKSIGGATLGSGITTAGASFFLTFCVLTLFQRLGSMCLIVTVVSIFVALFPLPAGLFACGPRYPGHCHACVPAKGKNDDYYHDH